MLDIFTKLAYQAFQESKGYFGLAHKTIATQVMQTVYPDLTNRDQSLSPKSIVELQKRKAVLFDRDLQDAERGIYPVEILFDNAWDDFFFYYPLVCLDSPRIWERRRNNQNQEFPANINTDGYPKYYLQNFHHQTDGYLSDWSANLYDLQVDILFNGTADAMRRRILAPLVDGLKRFADDVPAHQTRILDVACGTGRTLKFVRSALPQASLFGCDLSAAYLRKANQMLSKEPGLLPQLLQANGEDLPYVDNYFHAVVSVFLFHELPGQARQNVINECFRVVQPGGQLIICDSIQLSDSPELEAMMAGFFKNFHEPYYREYIHDDIGQRLTDAGFEDVSMETCFFSNYWVAQKPIEPIEPIEVKQARDNAGLSKELVGSV
ncbi:Methyltransferase type 11 [Thalassoporum mexicanum PCC 7367]|uniref:class I SAM-dependent methyltransferase n=1 Tax=Thalassoporum mexicanum TaxID=3457544 RepID=UPI00029FB9C7|nr:class I SAM-dependent methyltransferase [Pseudanabaena sp. PCC 7367]AFY69149.1 Methyltransferase type 11 [Pseudanabaena sp. PCC 7367]